jgi:hypothetical protein
MLKSDKQSNIKSREREQEKCELSYMEKMVRRKIRLRARVSLPMARSFFLLSFRVSSSAFRDFSFTCISISRKFKRNKKDERKSEE